jgi:hypothetical protein
MRIYRASNNLKLFACFIWCPIAWFTVWCLFKGAPGKWLIVVFVFVPMTLGLINLFLHKIIVDRKSVVRKNLFRSYALTFDQIKGYIDAGSSLTLTPVDLTQKRIKLTATLEQYDKLEKWVKVKFPNLDNAGHFLKRGKSISYNPLILLLLSEMSPFFFATLFLLHLPQHYFHNFLVFLICLVPWIIGSFPYLRKNRDKKRTSNFTGTLSYLIHAIVFSAGLLLINIYLSLKTFSYSNAWLPTLIISSVLFAWMIKKDDPPNNFKGFGFINSMVLLLLIGGYGLGCSVYLNTILDTSSPTYYNAIVFNKEKYYSFKSGTTYFMKISPWGPQKSTNKERVSLALYHSTNINDPIVVSYHKGALGIPWYRIEGD